MKWKEDFRLRSVLNERKRDELNLSEMKRKAQELSEQNGKQVKARIGDEKNVTIESKNMKINEIKKLMKEIIDQKAK